jgi:hypothetical protein
VKVKFEDGKYFNKDFILHQVPWLNLQWLAKLQKAILPDKSQYEILSTKVEMKLVKEYPGYQWSELENKW